MKFRYQAYDLSGSRRAAVIEASSALEATEILRREGLMVAQLAEALDVEGRAPPRISRGVGLRPGRVRALAGFLRQMAVLVSTGTRVTDALAAMERQTHDAAFARTIADVRRRVEEGATFAEALAAHPASFDRVAVSLVRAGESSGKLDVMLERLADIALRELRIRQTITGAMVYPMLLLCISGGVLVMMMVFVLPRFTGLFQTLDVPLPPTTRMLMGLSDLLMAWWWLMLGVLLGVVGGAVAWVRSPGGRGVVHRWATRAPMIGGVVRSFCTARIARVLGLLLVARVSLLEALDLSAQTVGNLEYRRLLDEAQQYIQRGDALSACLGRGALIEPAVIEAVRNAERTGQIGQVMGSVADFLDEENRMLVKSITSLLEPIILLSLGLAVGFIATSMFLPLFDLTASAGGGP